MSGFRSLLGGGGENFDGYDEFDPECVPDPGAFLEGHEVLTGEDHAVFHRLTRTLFEKRGVYDMTFGYNLARLNLDRRHPDAGYRYAIERTLPDDAAEIDAETGPILRAEFTPTTPFCPQSDTLTRGSFRAWNGLTGRHEYALVRVRVEGSHNRAVEINETLRRLETEFLKTGRLGDEPTDAESQAQTGTETPGDSTRGYDHEAPF